ncbi:uncharacterized protein LOC112570956 [Pomacea canaliculata]|uniref:uncharacterized protein LOC112570956 n=1 Tax=Pomacea canaliculata TaxID=400727 RepID=UPI000D731AE4|nr:uncharacterized protein LOC112570956 [Pomacea canaliculata]XP_025105497.1 uncharacterized protein LOC112570956 [Pomacea canaliculata]
MLTLLTTVFSCRCQPCVESCESRTLSVLCVVVVLLLSSAVRGQSCGQQTACAGGRPPDSRGCCPLGAGQVCGQRTGAACDGELGYRCMDADGNVTVSDEGVCTGTFDLNVTEVRQDGLDLQWRDFRPQDYEFEYALLYCRNSFTTDLSTWTTVDIGTSPEYTLRNLSPGTLYFIRVAIWEDAYEGILGTMSEAVWATTASTGHCTHNGQEIQVGHVTQNCEEVCTCQASGQFTCQPRCPPPQAPDNCTVHQVEECSCNFTVLCQEQQDTTDSPGTSGSPWTGSSASEALPCQYNGSAYSHGTNWTDVTNCSNCWCHWGLVTCHSLCQETVAPPGCVNPVWRRSTDGCCQTFECDPQDVCIYNDTTYAVGDVFNDDCGLCTCNATSIVTCISTCPPVYLPFPTLLCPFPHVRRTVCCDTVQCLEENIDAQTMISRLMAISYEPHSLTISFEVDRASWRSVTQDRYQVMTSHSGADPHSWRSTTVAPRRVDIDENSSSPSVLLHRSAAIQVGERVYVTLDQLEANTTYYIRVTPVTARDMGVTEESSNATILLGFLAATTLKEVSAVTSPPPSTHRSHQQVGLTVYNISYDAASFRWPTLDDESLSYVTGLVIEYRDDVTEDWNATALMLPTATSHRVTYLMANHKYFARLVALALPTDRISMSSVEFVTTTTYQDYSDLSLILIIGFHQLLCFWLLRS